jgi:hypothetical protein
MGKNLISLEFTAQDLEAIDAALAVLEEKFVGLISLRPEQIRGLAKMGDKSEAFCRQTLAVLNQNRQVVPPSFDLQEALADLTAHDALRDRALRLSRLQRRMDDTVTALGSDIYSASLEGYTLLKVSGRSQGLEDVRKYLSTRFARKRKADDGDEGEGGGNGGEPAE